MNAQNRTYSTRIGASPETVAAWHEAPSAFERLTPPWANIKVVESRGTMRPGDGKRLRLSALGPVGFDWSIVHESIGSGLGFLDVQEKGPFQAWRHEHRFIPNDDGSTTLEDRLDYVLPFGALGATVGGGPVQRELDRTFALRQSRTKLDIERNERTGATPMRIAITGSTGLVGKRLIPFLETMGHDVVRLVRNGSTGPNSIAWNPERGEIDRAALEGVDAVIHLAGVSIAGGLWTKKRKAAIRDSRVKGTQLLAETLASLQQPPKVFVSTSAVGFYGNAGSTELTEESPSGADFLSEVCIAWEAAANPAREAGIRVVHPRFGIVLASEGGSLPLMMKPFQFGVGGPVGNGKQYMSWIALDDLVGVLLEAVTNDALEGPVNATAPQPVTNREFGKTLGHVLHRPSAIPAPAFAMKLVGGQLVEELLLASQRVLPTRLQEAGFTFGYPTLEQALRHELGKPDTSRA